MASQWKLMWWKLRRHRGGDLRRLPLLLYLSTLVSEMIAPYELQSRDRKHIYAPPQPIHLFHEGEFVGPFVYGYKFERDMRTLRPSTRRTRQVSASASSAPAATRVRSTSGGVGSKATSTCSARPSAALFLLGTDRLGRDVLSRIIYGARISLTVGLIGIILSFVLGIVIGGIAASTAAGSTTSSSASSRSCARSRASPVAVAARRCRQVVADPGVLRHHAHSRAARLAQPRPRRALEAARLARGGLLYRRPADGRLHPTHHRPAPYAQLRQPPDRQRVLSIPEMILGETALSFGWAATADHQLGRALERGAEHPGRRALPLADAAHGAGDPGRLAFNFLGDGLRDAADPYK